MFLKIILPCLCACLFNTTTWANKVYGQVKDEQGKPLSFASVVVKGTTRGTSANSEGHYSLEVEKGNVVLIARYVGYTSVEKLIVVAGNDVLVDFELPEQQYDLGTVVVSSGEDPAYKVIRAAIAKRSFHEKENKSFSTDVYIKGRLQLRDFPKRFMGQKVDFEDGDSSKQKMIFLSETIARYSVQRPNEKVEVISTKVSGQSDAFGFSSPQIFSFYQNNINLGAINPRGFVSPIADNALNFYRYKLEGTFFENNQMINRVKVEPRRRYEPLFNGYINISEGDWRIQSVQLMLLKENQIQLADTIVIQQQYVQDNNRWVIKQQTIYPSIKFLGFDAYGSFVQVYDNFEYEPAFEPRFFNSTVLKIYDSANKKEIAYWDSIRPIPLVEAEVRDYIKKDSLEQLRKDPRYLDSLQKKRNTINIAALIFTGQRFSSEKKNTSLTINALLNTLSYNTTEGAVIDFQPVYTKKWDAKKRNMLIVTPELRYGFANKRYNANVEMAYRYGKKYLHTLSVMGGRKVYQFDNRNPVSAYGNSISTLLWERDVLRLYEAGVVKFSYRKGLGEGFTINAGFEYQDRRPMFTSTLHKWRDIPGRSFEPNITVPRHQSSVASVSLQWQPGSTYIEYPDRKIKIGSDFPTFTLSYRQGINNLFASDVDYGRWRFGLTQDVNMTLAGRFSYNVAAGGFLYANKAFLPDFSHYIANRVGAAAPYLASFQLMDYYKYSNTSNFYTEQHVEYHLNGLLTNKIPGFKKLNWFIVTGSNFLYVNSNSNSVYGEVFIGLENILKVGRIDFVQSFTRQGWETSGIRFSFAGMLR